MPAKLNAQGYTLKEEKFIKFYNGNGTQSAIKAGYSKKTAASQAMQMLKKPKIKNAIEKRQDKIIEKGIATREDRQKFWTKTMNGSKVNMMNRLRAAELLGKSEGDFLEKVEHSGEVKQGIIVRSSKHTVEL